MVRARPRAVLHELIGPRHQVALDGPTLQRLVPDIRQRDVYVCGPDGFGEGVRAAARRLAVPEERIHLEEFAF